MTLRLRLPCNDVRGGTRQRHFDGINFKPRKSLENAKTPISRVQAVLGALLGAHQTKT
ncbi:MAG: hypothetical protein ACM3PS_04555 [Syntrophothermus sp.]